MLATELSDLFEMWGTRLGGDGDGVVVAEEKRWL
jgi:hypothetical protein